MKEKLHSMNIHNYNELTAYINAYSNTDDEEGNKQTDFDEHILIVLDIITIFRKMKCAKVATVRINKQYEKEKKDVMEAYKLKIIEEVTDQTPEGDNPSDRDKLIEEEVEKKMKKYKCMYT